MPSAIRILFHDLAANLSLQRVEVKTPTMKVAFRTLKGEKFELEAEPEETVLDLKKRVVQKQNEDDYSGYRLIYKGKILDNAKTLADSGISGTGFVVVMPPKKAQSKPEANKSAASSSNKSAVAESKPAAAAPAASAAPATTSESAAPAPAPASAPASASAPAPASAPVAPAATLVTGAEYDATVRQICDMGFQEAEVKRALRAAFNNPDRAVDYLFNGIPASAQDPSEAAPPAAPAAAATPAAATAAAPAPAAGNTPAGGAPRATPPVTPGMPFNMFDQNAAAAAGREAGGQPGNLDFLRRPPFNNMRRVIQANPNVIHQLLRQLEQTDPALLQLINANRAEFLRLINEPVDDGAEAGDEVIQQLAQAMASAAAAGEGGPLQPGQILVTEEENQVINRLTELGSAMGLQKAHCVEAWLACDRDENLAANFLLNQAEDIRAAQAEDAALEAQARGNAPDNDSSGDGGNNASDKPPSAGN